MSEDATSAALEKKEPTVNKKSSTPKVSPTDACTAAITRAIKNSDTLQYLLDAVTELGGTSLNNIKCLSKEAQSFSGAQAGYVWENAGPTISRGDIVLLAEHLPYTDDSAMDTIVEKNLRHELIHAFDDARGHLDPTDCDHHACSEVRAARLSGDCFWQFDDMSGSVRRKSGITCVRNRAVSAVELNPFCKGYSERSVERVFSRCYKDYEPFVGPLYAMGDFTPKRPEWN